MQKYEKYQEIVDKKLDKSRIPINLNLREVVRRAKVGECWECGKEQVIMGYFETLSDFSTLLFHEAAHSYFGLDCSPNGEKKCYDFSRQICRSLGITYDEKIEKYGLDFVQLNIQGNQMKLVELVDKMPLRIQKSLSLNPQTR